MSSDMEPLARCLIDCGARLALAAERRSEVETLALQIGQPDLYTGGLRGAESAGHCLRWALQTCGRLDALVVAVGDGTGWSRAESDADEWLQRETRGAYLLTRAALPELRRNAGAVIGVVREGVHCAEDTQALQRWLTAFMRGVAIENAKFGVRAGSVAPGLDVAPTCRLLLGEHRAGGDPARAA